MDQSILPNTVKASTNVSEMNNFNRVQTFLKVDEEYKGRHPSISSESDSQFISHNEEEKVTKKHKKKDMFDWTEESVPSFAEHAHKVFQNPSSVTVTENSEEAFNEEMKKLAEKKVREGDKLKTFF